ncbi:hypothetical protein ES703_08350 [subsurface metagenome]
MVNQAEAILRGVSVAALPGEILRGVMPGDVVIVTAEVDYRGPRLDDIFYAAIGHRVVGFDEIWTGKEPVTFAQSFDWVTYPLVALVPITQVTVFPWTPGLFDLYVKLLEHSEIWHIPNAGQPERSNVIEVLLRAEFQNFGIVSYDIL